MAIEKWRKKPEKNIPLFILLGKKKKNARKVQQTIPQRQMSEKK